MEHISRLGKTLDEYRSGLLDFEQLQSVLDELACHSSEQKDDALKILKSEFDAGKLPTQVFFTLQSQLINSVHRKSPAPECVKETEKLEDLTVVNNIKNLSPDITGLSQISHTPDTNCTDKPSESRLGIRTAKSESLIEGHLEEGITRYRIDAPHPQLKIGTTLKNQFILEEEIGSGGMGVVFKARDLLMEEMRDRDPYVAIKVIKPELRNNKELLIALQREFRKAQKLAHPNIIHVMDFTRDPDTGHVFISMQYLRGKPLGRIIQESLGKGMAFRNAWPIIQAMAEALSYAHHKNIVHMDFKPGNVFVDENGDIKVLDFGIASICGRAALDAQNTVFNPQNLGALTPAYASLEMLENITAGLPTKYEADPRDDIYALGCVTYELLTGRHPFGKAQADEALRAGLEPKPISRLSRRQWHGLKRALAFHRTDRTPSADQFIRDIQKLSPWIWRATAGALLLISTAGAIVWLNPHEVVKCQGPELTAEAIARINDLMEVASVHFDVGYITTPTGNNALWAYEEVLNIDPCNEGAKKGIRRIIDAIEQMAWKSLEDGNRAESLAHVNEGLNIDPKHDGLIRLKQKLRE